jgi:hypothetical protein
MTVLTSFLPRIRVKQSGLPASGMVSDTRKNSIIFYLSVSSCLGALVAIIYENSY